MYLCLIGKMINLVKIVMGMHREQPVATEWICHGTQIAKHSAVFPCCSLFPSHHLSFSTFRLMTSSGDQQSCRTSSCKFSPASHVCDDSDWLYRPFLVQYQCAPTQDIVPRLHRHLSSGNEQIQHLNLVDSLADS